MSSNPIAMQAPAVHVENLGKRYQYGLTHVDSLSDFVSGLTKKLSRSWSKSPIPNIDVSKPIEGRNAEFWAIQDINFDVMRGEVFGVIGRNGAGKSTLLKIISRVTSPTTGRIDLRGRVASLLEVGTGFHPDLTGRENVYMNATLLGMTRYEVNQRLDEIIEFAGVGNFLDTQVKRYSSGMRVRLGFAVAAHLEPEILIVDEVLTVGDAEFQDKCLGKMRSVATGGRTVLFVSHNMGAVRSLCSRACLLEQGRLSAIGTTDVVVDKYLRANGQQVGWTKRFAADETIIFDGMPTMRPLSFAARSNDGDAPGVFATDQSIELTFECIPLQLISGLRVGVLVRNADNVTLFGSNTTIAPVTIEAATTNLIVSCKIPSNLLNRGRYTVDLAVDRPPHQYYFLDQESIQFEVTDVEGHGFASESLPGVVRPKLQWSQSIGTSHP